MNSFETVTVFLSTHLWRQTVKTLVLSPHNVPSVNLNGVNSPGGYNSLCEPGITLFLLPSPCNFSANSASFYTYLLCFWSVIDTTISFIFCNKVLLSSLHSIHTGICTHCVCRSRLLSAKDESWLLVYLGEWHCSTSPLWKSILSFPLEQLNCWLIL